MDSSGFQMVKTSHANVQFSNVHFVWSEFEWCLTNHLSMTIKNRTRNSSVFGMNPDFEWPVFGSQL